MQATHPQFRQLNLRTTTTAAAPLTVRDDELEDDEPVAASPVTNDADAGPEQLDSEAIPISRRRAQPAELSERVAAALAASRRAEANLRALFRTTKFLGASLETACETNNQLLAELASLHRGLHETHAHDIEPCAVPASGDTREALLEQALSDAMEQAIREREYLMADHDAFIAGLIADHDQEVARLRRRVSQAEAKLAAREAEDFGIGLTDEDEALVRWR